MADGPSIVSPQLPSTVSLVGVLPVASPATRQMSRNVFFYLLTTDLVALVGSIAIACALAYESSQHILRLPYLALGSSELPLRLGIWTTLICGVCVWFYVSGHYTVRRPLREEAPKIWSALFLLLLIDGFAEFVTKTDFSRGWLVSIWIVSAAALPVARIGIRRVLDSRGLWQLDAVIVGCGVHVDSVHEGLSGDRYLGYRVVSSSDPTWFTGCDRAEMDNKVREFSASSGIDVVILVPSKDELENSINLIDVLNIRMIPYALVPPIHRLPSVGLHMQPLLRSDAVLMTVRSGLLSPISRGVKRLFDVATASLLAIIFAPLLLLIAALVAADGGQVFFGHERVGRGGRPFRCFKFRTMAPNAADVLKKLLESDATLREEWLTTFKLKNDPRVTAIGRFLRKTSMDELPQLYNVLTGTMSLVGPRPVVSSELEQYYGEDALYYRMVLPGVTGLWQISGRSDTGYARRVHLDVWYVRNWSLWSDILILAGTLPSVLRSRGAY
jgi:Undecaprenyl-phosphate galactose phosphotransferase WbaP